MFRKLLAKLWSRIVTVASIKVWCDHEWKADRIEEIGEKFKYRVHVRCVHCGKRDFYSS